MNFHLRNNKGEYKTTTVLSILLSIFFLLKIIHVNIPLFHDELGVYGRALFHMLNNGPQLYPGGIDHYITRGHPLFFASFYYVHLAF